MACFYDVSGWNCNRASVVLRGVRSMDSFKAWYKNRWGCINNSIDIPLLDFCFCIGSLPILALIEIILIGTCPIWGIPFMLIKFLREE